MIDLARAIPRELRVLQNDVTNVAVAVLQLPGIDGLCRAAKRDFQFRQVLGARQCVQCTVGRCRDPDVPSGGPERVGQIAYDVTDAADFATGQGTVLRRQEYN